MADGTDGAQPKRREAARFPPRRVVAFCVVVLSVVLAAGVWRAGGRHEPPPDFSGPPGPETLFHAVGGENGDSLGSALVAGRIVRSAGAFADARRGVPAPIEPGYYVLHTRLSAKRAVAELADPARRRGRLDLRTGGLTVDGVQTSSNIPVPGLYALISLASCVPADGGGQRCVPVDELKQAARSSEPEELGVPDWARGPVALFPEGVPPDRRLEGLIGAGVLDFDPQAPPREILRELIAATDRQYRALGLVERAKDLGWTPYQVLVGASLVQREVFSDDFAKCARVILNRLAKDMPLAFDATINYVLPVQDIATSDAARGNTTPWNTYRRPGLTPAPIASPSYPAIAAMLRPAAGDWLFFVAVAKDGQTAFADTYAEHERNIALAHQNGVF